VDLVLRARALTHELRAARDPAPLLACLLVGQPHRIERPRHQQPRERARVQRVGLRLGVADLLQLLGVAITTRATCGSRIRVIASVLDPASSAT
jgi:type II secretory pathway predicted ATPase ExeA